MKIKVVFILLLIASVFLGVGIAQVQKVILGNVVIPSTRTLTIVFAGTGSGTVTVSGGASFSTTSTSYFNLPAGISLVLTGSPSGTDTFSGWSGAGCSGTGNCNITLNTNMTVTATFDAFPYLYVASYGTTTRINQLNRSNFTFNNYFDLLTNERVFLPKLILRKHDNPRVAYRDGSNNSYMGTEGISGVIQGGIIKVNFISMQRIERVSINAAAGQSVLDGVIDSSGAYSYWINTSGLGGNLIQKLDMSSFTIVGTGTKAQDYQYSGILLDEDNDKIILVGARAEPYYLRFTKYTLSTLAYFSDTTTSIPGGFVYSPSFNPCVTKIGGNRVVFVTHYAPSPADRPKVVRFELPNFTNIATVNIPAGYGNGKALVVDSSNTIAYVISEGYLLKYDIDSTPMSLLDSIQLPYVPTNISLDESGGNYIYVGFETPNNKIRKYSISPFAYVGEYNGIGRYDIVPLN